MAVDSVKTGCLCLWRNTAASKRLLVFAQLSVVIASYHLLMQKHVFDPKYAICISFAALDDCDFTFLFTAGGAKRERAHDWGE